MRTGRFLAIVLVLGVSSSAASADSRWLPWFGCWDLIYESVDYEEVGAATDGLLCLSPSTDDAENIGVSISTFIDKELVVEDTLIADGVRHPVEESGCRGWQVNEWSHDGHRLFVRSEMSCEGDVERKDSFLTKIAATIVDVKPNGNLVLEAKRYIQTDEEKISMTLTGTVRPADVAVDNSVSSSNVADLAVTKTTKGIARDGQKRGWLVRLFQAISPF